MHPESIYVLNIENFLGFQEVKEESNSIQFQKNTKMEKEERFSDPAFMIIPRLFLFLLLICLYNFQMLGLSSDRSPQKNLPEKVLPDFQGLDGSSLVKHELLE